MGSFVTGVAVSDGLRAHNDFVAVIRLAREWAVAAPPHRRAGAEATLRQLQVAYADFVDQMTLLETKTAAFAEQRMRENLDARKVRARAATTGQLRAALTARPLRLGVPVGAVGIADLAKLAQVRNPNSDYGPYWRAQEYGTGTDEVPSQRGREIKGFFVGGGHDPEPPRLGATGPHPAFIGAGSGIPVGPRGGTYGGKGTINREIEGKHFIRDAAQQTTVQFLKDLGRLEARALGRITAATGTSASAPSGRRRRRGRRP